jgi:sulfatase modifying factor 1
MSEDLRWIPGQTYAMGSDRHYPEEGPVHQVSVDGFWIEAHQVTNADFPGAPADNLQPGSMVFTQAAGPIDLRHINLWWTWTPGASWRCPEGSGSSITGREDHPAVHVGYEDAAAYANWAGRELPSEAEWEAAARGGLDQMIFIWGDHPEGASDQLANFWHGDFPWRPDSGYGATTPVASFPPNAYGLYDMAGNVWDWTADWYTDRHRTRSTSPAAFRVIRAAARSTKAMTGGNRSSGCLARCSRVAHISVPTAIACATDLPPGGRR